jgi:hypothetical protein
VQELATRSCPIAGASTASAVVTHSMVSGAPSTPLPPFSLGRPVHELPLPSHPDARPRQPPEHPPRRRTPPPSQFFRPSRRQEARVSCRFHPLVQRVTPPLWMIERPTSPHLSHGSATAVTRARRAATAPVRARVSHAVPAGGPRRPWAGSASGPWTPLCRGHGLGHVSLYVGHWGEFQPIGL